MKIGYMDFLKAAAVAIVTLVASPFLDGYVGKLPVVSYLGAYSVYLSAALVVFVVNLLIQKYWK